ncbi:TfoX/Sxy family protein [Paludibacterium yongneupense]|uniref:TfoX/Sxy family protein n=1 Tax=Paludibacterium yongneupense TaxID=400061 RepID=UPI0004006E9D|nr:TfoX/Sxy family protein [Paludibacterium yongneupense]
MASTRDFVDYVCEQAGLGAALGYRKMFGEYALYLDGKVVGLVCDNALYLKPTQAARELLSPLVEGLPYPGAKAHFLIEQALDEPELLRRLLQATAAELPPPRPKPPKPPGRSPRR